MSCVIVATINSTRSNHANRRVRFTGLHSASLYRRSMGTEQIFFSDVEGILHVASRMVLRQVQCFKVVVIFFDFRTFHYFKAHTHKDFFDFTHGQGYRMQMTFARLTTGQSDVHFFICQFISQRFLFQYGSFSVDFFFQQVFDFVNDLTDFRTFFCGQFAHAAQNFSHRTFFAKIFDTQVFQCVQRANFCQFCQSLLFNSQ